MSLTAAAVRDDLLRRIDAGEFPNRLSLDVYIRNAGLYTTRDSNHYITIVKPGRDRARLELPEQLHRNYRPRPNLAEATPYAPPPAIARTAVETSGDVLRRFARPAPLAPTPRQSDDIPPFLQVIHESAKTVELTPHHYTVVRTTLPMWEPPQTSTLVSELGGALRCRLQMTDFAVLWDEDRDTRVWGVVDQLHAAGLLGPVLFIGEHEGTIQVTVNPLEAFGAAGFDMYCKLVEDAAQRDRSDDWVVLVQLGPDRFASRKYIDFLSSLFRRWQLGPHKWVPFSTHDCYAAGGL